MNGSDNAAGLLAIMLTLGMVFIFILFWLVWLSVVVGSLVFWVMMLVDVSKREFPQPNDRTTWILVVALAGLVGSLIYYFAVKRPGDKGKHKPTVQAKT